MHTLDLSYDLVATENGTINNYFNFRLFAPQLVRIKDSIKFGRREFNQENFPPKRFTGTDFNYWQILTSRSFFFVFGSQIRRFLIERIDDPLSKSKENNLFLPGKTVRYIRVGDNPHSRASLSPRRNTTPMSYSLFDWETSGREFLYSKTRSPPTKLTVSIK